MEAGTPMSGDFAEALAATIRAQPALGWMTSLRTAAMQRFDQAGFPTPRLEDWRHTNLKEYASRSRRLALPSVTGTVPDGAALAALAGRLLPTGMGLVAVFHAGRLLDALSQLEPPSGASCSRLADAQRQAVWADSLSADAGEDAPPLAALNAALLGDGLVIEVAAGAVISQPLYVVHASAGGRSAQNRLVLRLGAGSRCTLIEHHLGEGAGIANSVADIRCGRDAQLGYIRLQQESGEALHLSQQRLHLADGAEASLLGIDLGGALVRNTLRVGLEGAGAGADIRGLFFVDGRRHVDNLTRVDHRALATRCYERYRGIVEDAGHGVFNGKIIVHEGADQTSAELRNENLLLSRQAEVDTKPELEIYTDDVKCAHGATTGQLDESSVFYLRSRGIGEDEARRMLMAAFAHEIIGRIPVAEVKAHVIAVLGERLPDLGQVGTGQ